jgi:ribosomal protein S14
MSDSKPLKCSKCGRPIGYVEVAARSALEVRPNTSNLHLVATCVDCHSRRGFYRPTF